MRLQSDGWRGFAAAGFLLMIGHCCLSPVTAGEPGEGASLSTQQPAAGIARDYLRHCMGCHGKDGLGVPPAVPRLLGFMGYYARSAEGRAYLVRVPGVANASLDDARLAALLNWTLLTYSAAELPREFEPFTAKEVSILRAQRLPAPSQTRRTVLNGLVEGGLIEPALAREALSHARQPSFSLR
jgi:cytochrome c553